MKKTISILMAFLFVHYSYAQTAVAPTAPVIPASPDYTSCNALTSLDQKQSCQQSKDQQYQVALSGYNTALKNYQAQLAASNTAPTTSALDNARAIETQNSQGKDSYKTTQIVTMVASMAAAAAAVACGIHPCKAVFTKIAIGMAALSMLSGLQSGKHASAQYSACTTANQLTTTPSSCGSTPTAYNPSTYPAYTQDGGGSTTTTPANIVDSNGNCTASQELCAQITASLPPGTSLKDYQRGLSAFASGKAPFKVNPDGSLTRTDDGKKLDLAKLGTEAGLIEAGFTAAEAKSLLANANKGASSLEDTAKSASGTPSAIANSGLFDDASAAAARAAGGIGFGVNGEANSASLDADKNRSLASVSEGLVRDFNGETIGVQGDDIFKMMKRRYLLKDKQDSFMSTAP